MVPKVSVCVIAYKHEPYVAQALDSVLMQETDFEVECIVGDDASPDGTADVIQSYVARYPGRIQAVLRETNIGARRNVMDVKRRAKGQYAILLEGDDYWTDPHKLQRQADFLDAHPDCVACAHAVRMVDADGAWDGHSLRPDLPVPERIDLGFLLAHGCTLHTSSVLYRREMLAAPPPWMETIPSGDMATFVLLALQGSIGFLDACMGDRRNHPGGLWSSKSPLERALTLIAFRREIRRHLPSRFRPMLNAQIRRYYEGILAGAVHEPGACTPWWVLCRSIWHASPPVLVSCGWAAMKLVRRGVGLCCGLVAMLKAPVGLDAPRLVACAVLNHLPPSSAKQ